MDVLAWVAVSIALAAICVVAVAALIVWLIFRKGC